MNQYKKVFLDFSFMYQSFVVPKNSKTPKVTNIYSRDFPVPCYFINEEKDFPMIAKVSIGKQGEENFLVNEYRLFENKYLMRNLKTFEKNYLSPLELIKDTKQRKQDLNNYPSTNFINYYFIDHHHKLYSCSLHDKTIVSSSIKRYATPEEIQNIKILRSSEKHNLILKTEDDFLNEFEKRVGFFVSFKNAIYLITEPPVFVVSNPHNPRMAFLSDINQKLPDCFNLNTYHFHNLNNGVDYCYTWDKEVELKNKSQRMISTNRTKEPVRKKMLLDLNDINNKQGYKDIPLYNTFENKLIDSKIDIFLDEKYQQILDLPTVSINTNYLVSLILLEEKTLLSAFAFFDKKILESFIEISDYINKYGFQDNTSDDLYNLLNEHVGLLNNFFENNKNQIADASCDLISTETSDDILSITGTLFNHEQLFKLKDVLVFTNSSLQLIQKMKQNKLEDDYNFKP